MRYMIIIWVMVLLVIIPGDINAVPVDLQIGCRPQGMGGAYVAIVDDVNAIYWNPAGLVNVKSKELGFMYFSPMQVHTVDICYSSLAVPLHPEWAVGISYLTKLAVLEQGIGLRYKKSRMLDSTFILGGGHKFTPVLSVGISVKRFGFDSVLDSGGGFGYDMGILYNYPVKKYRNIDNVAIGFVLRNFLAEIKDETFPATVRLGFAGWFYQKRLVLSIDVNTKKGVNKRKGYIVQYHAGCEIVIVEGLWLRFGMDRGDMTAGVGIAIRNWQIDYSFNRLDKYELEYSHRASVMIRF